MQQVEEGEQDRLDCCTMYNCQLGKTAHTNHESFIFKFVPQVDVSNKVSTLLLGISPWHGGTHWTHLYTGIKYILLTLHQQCPNTVLSTNTSSIHTQQWATIVCATYHLQSLSFVSVIHMLQQGITGKVLCTACRTGEGVAIRTNPAAHTQTGDCR